MTADVMLQIIPIWCAKKSTTFGITVSTHLTGWNCLYIKELLPFMSPIFLFVKNLSLISWEHPTNCGMRRQHFFITLNNKTAFRSRKRICCSWELLSIFLESFYGTFRNEWCLEIRMQQKGPLIYIMWYTRARPLDSFGLITAVRQSQQM